MGEQYNKYFCIIVYLIKVYLHVYGFYFLEQKSFRNNTKFDEGIFLYLTTIYVPDFDYPMLQMVKSYTSSLGRSFWEAKISNVYSSNTSNSHCVV